MSFKKAYGESDSGAFRLSGHWTMELRGPDGKLKERHQGPNVICTNGKEFLASFLNSAVAAAATFTMRYLAIGSDSTAEAAGNTALGSELARQSATVSYVSGQIFRVVTTFAAGTGTGSVNEYGLFSSSSAGTMLARKTQTTIAKGASDTLTVTADFTIS